MIYYFFLAFLSFLITLMLWMVAKWGIVNEGPWGMLALMWGMFFSIVPLFASIGFVFKAIA